MSSIHRKSRTATGVLDKIVEKQPVKYGTLSNVASLSSVSTTFGGGTLTKGVRVLLAGQSTASQNGIYVAGTVSGGNCPLTRSTDFNDADEVGVEVVVAVQSGSLAGKRYRVTATGVVGTDAIVFTEMVGVSLTSVAVSNGGSGNAGKVLALDGDGKVAGRVIETDGARLDGLTDAAGALRFTAATELTIASGAITVTQSAHRVDTESDGASDDLDTISGGAAERLLLLRPESGSRTVVLKHNTGNIICPEAKDISLSDAQDFALLVFANSKWTVVAYHTLAQVHARLADDNTLAGALVVTGLVTANGGNRLGGSSPAAAADKVGQGVVDVEGATTAALERVYEGGGKERYRMASAAGDIDILRWSESVADDGTVVLGAYPTNGGRVTVSTRDEGATYSIHTDGTVVKINGSTNTSTTDEDTKLCVFTGGGNVTAKNRLGGVRWLVITYERD